MSILSKKFHDIGKLKLIRILAEVKQDIDLLGINDISKFKLEFILEELITNSFSYSTEEHNIVCLCIDIKADPLRINYTEVGVNDFNFQQYLTKSKDSTSLQKLIPGGLGLSLMNDLSLEFNYYYDPTKRARYYKLKI